jgi:hypothetical protein
MKHQAIFLLTLFALVYSQENCTAWGIRLSFGEYYMDSTNNNYLYVTYNTNVKDF